MSRTALVVGGTGPTGPYVLQGLLERGFDVSIFHRGTHEPEGLPEVRHIHGDPHFPESIEDAVGGTEFDLVVAAYGRTRYLAEAFVGRTEQFISIGGPPRYAGFFEPDSLKPRGIPLPIRETSPVVAPSGADLTAATKFGRRLVDTEEAVFASHPGATHLIYPVVYGPRNIVPWEWSIIKRIHDGRTQLVLPDDGLAVHSRGAARNMAHVVLLSVDRRDVARGNVYNCADDVQYSVRQFTELILMALDAEMEIVGVPSAIAPHFKSVYVPSATSTSPHGLLDTSKAREQLGYRDVVSPLDALRESVEWYRAHPIEDVSTYAGFADRFDYALEDTLICAWRQCIDQVLTQVPQVVGDEVHPMPHPKAANQLVDDRGR